MVEEISNSSHSQPKYTKEQMDRLKKYIEIEKEKAGGDLKPVFYKGIDKNGKPFKYINESLI